MNGDLNVFAYAVHKVFSADKDFSVKNVYVANMIGRNGISFKGRFVGLQQVSFFVVFIESLAAAYVVELAICANALTTFDFKCSY